MLYKDDIIGLGHTFESAVEYLRVTIQSSITLTLSYNRYHF